MNPFQPELWLQTQQNYFHSGATRSLAFRKSMLRRLAKAIRDNEAFLLQALKEDLGKPETEAYTNEIGILHLEIKHTIRHLKKWMKPESTGLEFFHWPGSGRIYKDPYGTVLIIAPWNYPVQLLLAPLIGAIAGGNTALVKPSEVAPATEAVLARMLGETFGPEYIRVVTGGPAETGKLLALPVDKIFFTGSTQVGRIVMEAAARNLTPLTLELGGKSPVIVAADANLELAARKIAWGKFNNAGQTCVAPDYILVQESVKGALVEALARTMGKFYGQIPQNSQHYGRIISDRHFARLQGLLAEQKVLVGGDSDPANRYMAPTLLDEPAPDSPVMQEEIFGPLLPIIGYDTLDDAISRVRALPKPLALYLFTQSRQTEKRIMEELSFGGGGVNATILQVASAHLPFGGVGPSGMGSYHGRASFEAFTHRKSVIRQGSRLDPGLVYPGRTMPLKWLRKIME